MVHMSSWIGRYHFRYGYHAVGTWHQGCIKPIQKKHMEIVNGIQISQLIMHVISVQMAAKFAVASRSSLVVIFEWIKQSTAELNSSLGSTLVQLYSLWIWISSVHWKLLNTMGICSPMLTFAPYISLTQIHMILPTRMTFTFTRYC